MVSSTSNMYTVFMVMYFIIELKENLWRFLLLINCFSIIIYRYIVVIKRGKCLDFVLVELEISENSHLCEIFTFDPMSTLYDTCILIEFANETRNRFSAAGHNLSLWKGNLLHLYFQMIYTTPHYESTCSKLVTLIHTFCTCICMENTSLQWVVHEYKQKTCDSS